MGRNPGSHHAAVASCHPGLRHPGGQRRGAPPAALALRAARTTLRVSPRRGEKPGVPRAGPPRDRVGEGMRFLHHPARRGCAPARCRGGAGRPGGRARDQPLGGVSTAHLPGGRAGLRAASQSGAGSGRAATHRRGGPPVVESRGPVRGPQGSDSPGTEAL